MATQTTQPPALPSKKKALIRRLRPDASQLARHVVQGLFLLLNGWLGIQFYLWARYFERGGTGLSVARPPGVEGWLPIAGLMNTKYLVMTGRVPAIHPAAMFLFIGFMLMSLLLKKAFCSWLCPVGTFSEILWRLGRRIFGRNLRLPRWFDIPLRGLKYILLGLFVAVIGAMSAEALEGFMATPYGLVADVKMLNFFRTLSAAGIAVMAILIVFSFFINNFWCRYLCPYGGLLGLLAMAGPLRIKRDVSLCIDCGKCARACPSALNVDQLVTISSAECTGCLNCVAACPVESSLYLSVAGRRKVPIWAMAGGVAVLFFGCVAIGQFTGHWHTDLPEKVYLQLVPRANEFAHP